MSWDLSFCLLGCRKGKGTAAPLTRALLKEAARKVWRAETEGESLPKGLRYKTSHSLQKPKTNKQTKKKQNKKTHKKPDGSEAQKEAVFP